MDRARQPKFAPALLKRRVPSMLVWLFMAGMASGIVLGIFLGGLLPGVAPRGAIPAFTWSKDATLYVHPGKARETLPGALLALLPSAGIPPEATSPPNGAGGADSAQTWDVVKELGTLPMDSEERYVAYMSEHFGEDATFLQERWALASRFQKTHELQGNAIQAFLRTPREHFVRQANIAHAYDDSWIPIGWGATITDPDVVSMMTSTLDVKPGHKVLEIGTGSGYQSAILSHLSNHIYSIEIIEPLFRETDALYTELEPRYPSYRNIRRKLGDGFYGWEKYAPFDRIIVTCAVDHLPPPLIQQLAPNGIMVVPLGPPARQYIMKVERSTDDKGNVTLKRTDVYNGVGVKFIPFTNEQGQSYSSQGG